MSFRVWQITGIALFLFVSTLFPSPAPAADYYWSVTSGDWSVASNWGGTVPTTGGTAYIGNGGTALMTTTVPPCGSFYLANVAGKSGTVSMSAGNLSTKYEEIGYSGTGIFTQSGGTHAVSGELNFGNKSGSTGIYNLSGGLMSAGVEFIGYDYGMGRFNQSGGTHIVNSCLYVSYWSSQASYDLSGGQLSAYQESIGYFNSGEGIFRQSAGINTTPFLHVYNAGTYILTGGTLNTSGIYNEGVVDLTGSTATINAPSAIVNLGKGNFTNAQNVVFNLDSHSLLIVPSGIDPSTYFTTFNSNGALIHQAGSPLTISSERTIFGFGSIDDFVDCTGGTISATSSYAYGITLNGGIRVSNGGSVDLGSCSAIIIDNSDSGISSGQLSASEELVGYLGTGAFSQSDGFHTTGALSLGAYIDSTGTYNLSGGQLSTICEFIGETGTGTFIQTGGSHTIDSTLYMGYLTSKGTYTLSNGVLSADTENLGNYGQAFFTQTGGTHSIKNDLYLSYGNSASDSTGIYTLSGGQFSAAHEYIGDDYGHGTITQTGGTNTVLTALLLAHDVHSVGTYNLEGGMLALHALSRGSGTARFNFGGGTLRANGTLTTSLPMNITGTGGNATIDDGGYAVSLSGLLAGVGGLNKCGSGTLTLGGTNTYSGGTYVSEGTLTVGNSSALGFGGLFVSNSGNVQFGPYSFISNDPYSGISGGSLSSSSQYVGSSGVGVFTQTGGTNKVFSNLYLGYGTDSTGVYHLSGSGYLSASQEFIGYSGGGTFDQSGGTNSVSQGLQLGQNSGSTGTYYLSGDGYLYAYSEVIGVYGTGQFTQDGGTHSISTILYLGLNTGSSGNYSLDGTGFLSAANEVIGGFGNGAFIQKGGTNSVSFLTLGGDNGVYGTYELTGNGLLSVYTEYIGDSANGIVTQTGGTHSIGNSLFLGNRYDSTGTYNLSGTGLLSAASESVGNYGTGVFNQTGGTNLIANLLYLGTCSGGTGTYHLSGTGFLNADSEHIGESGVGVFDQSGGTNAIAHELYLGTYSGVTGTYLLSGSGKVSASNEYLGLYGVGSFNQSGGTNAVTNLVINSQSHYTLTNGSLVIAGGLANRGGFDCSGGSGSIAVASGIAFDLINNTIANAQNTSLYIAPGSVLMIAAGYDPKSHFGSYVNEGATYVAGTTFTLSTGKSLFTSGSFDDLVVCSGAIATDAFGSINLNDGLILFGGANVNLGSGSLTVGDAVSCMTGGSLTLANQYVGKNGVGSFSQTGGTTTITNNGMLSLGNASGATGTYYLRGAGFISAKTEAVGYSGIGKFTQTGGTNSVSDKLYLGYNAGSSGTYSLSGTGALCGAHEIIGYQGVGSFSQTGGSNSGTTLDLGFQSGSTGIYSLSGTSYLGEYYEYIGYSGAGSFIQTGGTHIISGPLNLGGNSGSSGVYSLSGTSKLSAGYEYIGNLGSGTFTQTGGTHYVTNQLTVGYQPSSTGTYNLEGGLLITKSLSKGSGTAQFNFGGGTLQASGTLSSALDMTLTGMGGDAKIDTAGYDVTLSGVLSGSGGLEKQGEGSLVLSGNHTYTGETVVLGGILQIKGDYSTGGKISVADGAGIVFGTPFSPGLAPENTAGQAGSGTQGEIVVVPEPGAWVLLAASFFSIAVAVRRRN